MRKGLAFAALVGGLTAFGAVPAMAAPPGLPTDNPNPNAYVLEISCEGVNGGQPFLIWAPNGNGWTHGAGLVGMPLGVDDAPPVGVQKFESQGNAFDRAIACSAPIGTVYVMPTGAPG